MAAKTSCLLTAVLALLVLALLGGTLWQRQSPATGGEGLKADDDDDGATALLPNLPSLEGGQALPWPEGDQAAARNLIRPESRQPLVVKIATSSTTELPLPAALEPLIDSRTIIDVPLPESKGFSSGWGFSSDGFHVQIDSDTSVDDENDVWDARTEQNSEHSTTTLQAVHDTNGVVQCGASDQKIWKDLGKKFPVKTMKNCAGGCYGQEGCVTDCVRRKEGFSEDCSGCFGSIASCTASYCMFQCIGGGNSNCRACVAQNCDDALWACLGFEH